MTNFFNADVFLRQEKLEVVKQKEPQVEALHSRLRKLNDASGRNDPTVVALQEQFDHFTEKWAHVVEKIGTNF